MWRGIAPRGASFKEHVQLLRGAQSRSEAFSPSSARSRRRRFNEFVQVGGRLIAVRTLGQTRGDVLQPARKFDSQGSCHG